MRCHLAARNWQIIITENVIFAAEKQRCTMADMKYVGRVMRPQTKIGTKRTESDNFIFLCVIANFDQIAPSKRERLFIVFAKNCTGERRTSEKCLISNTNNSSAKDLARKLGAIGESAVTHVSQAIRHRQNIIKCAAFGQCPIRDSDRSSIVTLQNKSHFSQKSY